MKTLRLKSVITLGLLTLWGASVATAANISGTYADKGTMVTADASVNPPEVSLHALLGLEFNPDIGLMNYALTETVEITDWDDWLEIITRNPSGTEISKSRWGPQNGFSHQNGYAVFRLAKNNDEFYSFLMKPAADGSAMELRIYKVQPSALGPGANNIGTYFFVKTK